MPFLLIFNLFFGRLFFKVRLWLAIEAALFLILLITGYIASRRIALSAVRRKRGEVIDVSAEVVEEKKKIS